MGKKLIWLISIMLLTLALISGCTANVERDPPPPGIPAKWGEATWGQSKWNT